MNMTTIIVRFAENVITSRLSTADMFVSAALTISKAMLRAISALIDLNRRYGAGIKNLL